MANWITVRPLENPLEVNRRKNPSQLYASNVLSLNKLVEEIRKSKNGDKSVPWFDPKGAGINAKVLMLLQDPSNIAKDGTGFISPDNPDKTADYTTYFRNKAKILPKELIHWNIVPWSINGRKAATEIEKAKPFLIKLLTLLTKLEVVICMGLIARDGWNKAFPNNPCLAGWLQPAYSNNHSIIALTCPHPSPQSIKGYHPLIDALNPSERIERTLSNVRKILDKRD